MTYIRLLFYHHNNNNYFIFIFRGGWDRTGIDDIQRDEASATSSNALPKIAATPLSTTTLEVNLQLFFNIFF